MLVALRLVMRIHSENIWVVRDFLEYFKFSVLVPLVLVYSLDRDCLLSTQIGSFVDHSKRAVCNDLVKSELVELRLLHKAC